MNSEPFQARDIFHSLISENKKKLRMMEKKMTAQLKV